MFEMLINPRKGERKPWELFFVGAFYASISLLLVEWIFAKDAVLSFYSGILVVTFTVMLSLPFVYYTLKLEEKKILEVHEGTLGLLKEHKKAIVAFLWLFFGFVVALSFWYIILPSHESFHAQTETFCLINSENELKYENCVREYGMKKALSPVGFLTGSNRLFLIFTNNLYVLLFTLIFSLIFGAGVIFVLAWNASVIAVAVGIFAKKDLITLPFGILRYMIHGFPEIASYFIVALAGGMISMAVIKHEFGTEKFWKVLKDSLNLVVIALVVLFFAAMVEVFFTPLLF